MARTEQEWMQFQAHIRAIRFDPNTTDEQKQAAQAAWEEAMIEYQEQHPLITGVFTYTQEQIDEAKKHGF